MDVHLRILWRGHQFDYRACVTAALVFVQDWRTLHYHDAVRVTIGDADKYPRLPNERLYLEP